MCENCKKKIVRGHLKIAARRDKRLYTMCITCVLTKKTYGPRLELHKGQCL